MNPLIYIVEDDEGVPVIIVSAKSDEISFCYAVTCFITS